jgi:hypothetical protein
VSEAPEQQREPTRKDSPNQQNVRPDGSGPGTPPEGSGGSTPPVAGQLPAQQDAAGLDAMTKDELLAYAQELGVSPANAGMTKDELRAGIDAHQAEA